MSVVIDPEQFLNHLADVIKNRPFDPAKQWMICYFDNAFRCLPAQQRTGEMILFAIYPVETLVKGLSIDQWNQLKKSAYSFYLNKMLVKSLPVIYQQKEQNAI